MKIPNKIKIGGREWKVVFDTTEHHEDRRGVNYKEKQEIRINPNIHKEVQEVTFTHEILHACFDFVGIGYKEKLTEEEFCEKISPILTSVLKENNLLK